VPAGTGAGADRREERRGGRGVLGGRLAGRGPEHREHPDRGLRDDRRGAPAAGREERHLAEDRARLQKFEHPAVQLGVSPPLVEDEERVAVLADPHGILSDVEVLHVEPARQAPALVLGEALEEGYQGQSVRIWVVHDAASWVGPRPGWAGGAVGVYGTPDRGHR